MLLLLFAAGAVVLLPPLRKPALQIPPSNIVIRLSCPNAGPTESLLAFLALLAARPGALKSAVGIRE